MNLTVAVKMTKTEISEDIQNKETVNKDEVIFGNKRIIFFLVILSNF